MAFELLIGTLSITAGIVISIVVGVRLILWLGGKANRYPARAENVAGGMWTFFKLLLCLPLLALLVLALSNISLKSWSAFGLGLGAAALCLGLLVALWLPWETLRAKAMASTRFRLACCVIVTLLLAGHTVEIATGSFGLPRHCTHRSALVCAPLNLLFDLGGRYAAAALPGLLTLAALWATFVAARKALRVGH